VKNLEQHDREGFGVGEGEGFREVRRDLEGVGTNSKVKGLNDKMKRIYSIKWVCLAHHGITKNRNRIAIPTK
jgi:hypothetical protein